MKTSSLSEVSRNVPEAFYEILAVLAPGILALQLSSASAPIQSVLRGVVDVQLNGFERGLLWAVMGYAIGQALTVVSDLLIRRPTFRLFGEPLANLLGRKQDREPVFRHHPKMVKNPELRKSLNDTVNRAVHASSVPPDSYRLYDILEQTIKRRDYPTGLLCQKRHALVVFCRNMVVVALLALAAYWYLGWQVRTTIGAIIVSLLMRWDYLRARRADFVLSSLHVCLGDDDELPGNQSDGRTVDVQFEKSAAIL